MPSQRSLVPLAAASVAGVLVWLLADFTPLWDKAQEPVVGENLAHPVVHPCGHGKPEQGGEVKFPPHQMKLWAVPAVEPEFAAFQTWANRHLAQTREEQEAGLAEGVRLAEERRGAMVRMIESDPRRALELAVPRDLRRSLPPEVVALLEVPVDLRADLMVWAARPDEEGILTVKPTWREVVVDGQKHEAFVYGNRLGQPSRKAIPIHGIALDRKLAVSDLPGRPLEPREMAEIKASGQAQRACPTFGEELETNNDEVALQSGEEFWLCCSEAHGGDWLEERARREQELPPGSGFAQSGGAQGAGVVLAGGVAASAYTEGDKSFLFIRVDFSDATTDPWADSDNANLVDRYKNAFGAWSYGRMTVKALGSGTSITPVLRMPKSSAAYNGDADALWTDATNASNTAGFNPSNYNFRVVCMPGNSPGWGWGGLGAVGGPKSWVRGTGVTAQANIGTHEVGHNLGLNHAHFYDPPDDSVIGSGGTTEEYGDPFDTMGGASTENPFNAYYKRYLNWIRSAEYVRASSNGTYRIAAHDDADATGVRGLAVTRTTSQDYIVEYRTEDNAWLDRGAGLRWGPRSGNGATSLLDVTPTSSNGKNDSAIPLGFTFSESSKGIHITPIAVIPADATNAFDSLDVVVNLNPPATNRPPTAVGSANLYGAAVNASVTYSVAASDPDGDALAYYWDLKTNSPQTSTTSKSRSYTSSGLYSVSVLTTDMKGKTELETIPTRVGTFTANTAPTASGATRTTNVNTAVDVDLWPLVADTQTADSGLSFKFGTVVGGNVVLLADKRTARFTPTAGFSGAASFQYTVIDVNEDPRLVTHLAFENNVTDSSYGLENGTLGSFGTGSTSYAADVAAALAPYSTRSLKLNGAGARVTVQVTSTDFNLTTNEWTASLWFKRNATVDDDFLFFIGGGNGTAAANELSVYCPAGANTVVLRETKGDATNDALLTSAATATPGVWHHVAVVSDLSQAGTSKFRLYLNGTLVGEASATVALSQATPLVFGGHSSTTTNLAAYLDGNLDEVALFADNLSAAAIADLAARPASFAAGATATQTVAVNVNAVAGAPTISNITDKSTQEDTPSAPITFTIGDDVTPASALTLSITSSDPTILTPSGAAFGGSGANRSVVLTPLPNATGSVTVTVVVTDAEGKTGADSFVLTVLAVNDLPTLSTVQAQSTPEDIATGELSVVVTDVETPAANLQLTGTSSNATLIPNANILLGGTNSNRWVNVKPASGRSGNAVITLTVNDGTATATSSFSVEVTPTNDAPTLTFVRPVGGSVALGQGLGLQVDTTLADDSGAAPSIAWQQISGPGTASFSNAATADPALQFSQPGSYVLRATVSDGALTSSADLHVCVLAEPQWQHLDVGAVGAPSRYAFRDGNLQIVTRSAGVTGVADAFHFVHQKCEGDCTITAHVSQMLGTATAGKAGVMIRDALTPDAPFFQMSVRSNGVPSFQFRSSTGGTAESQDAAAATGVPVWLRIVKEGNQVAGFSSLDGLVWTQVGAPQTVDLGTDYFAGISATSGGNTTLGTFLFTHVALTAHGWESTDIGYASAAASTSRTANGYTIIGGGLGVTGASDQFRFMHRWLEGDGEIIAKVASIQPVATSSQAGVMFRDSLEPNARTAFMTLTPNGGMFRYRAEPSPTPVVANVVTDFRTGVADGFEAKAMPDTLGSGSWELRSCNKANPADVGVTRFAYLEWSSAVSQYERGGASHTNGIDAPSAVVSGTNLVVQPGTGNDAFAIVRWTSSVSGRINLSGRCQVPSTSSDGVNFHIYVNGLAERTSTVAGGANLNYEQLFDVNVGDIVDIAIGPNANNTNDTTNLTAIIKLSDAIEYEPATSTARPPYWVKLARSGDTFTGYHSADGVTWTRQGDPLTLRMNPGAFVGLGVSGRVAGTTCEAVFENVRVIGGIGNVAPRIDSFPLETTLNSRALLDAGIHDDGLATAPTFSWLQSSGPATSLSSATVRVPTVQPAAAGVYGYQVTVDDGAAKVFQNVSLTARQADSSTLVASGATWRYYDAATAPTGNWKSAAFNDSTWLAGPAQLGYGDSDEATVLNSTNGRITSYFRAAFAVANPAAHPWLTLRLLRDDGAVIYLNGQEILRSNMPGGTIDHTTLASAAVGAEAEKAWFCYSFPGTALVTGNNVLAVELHQSAASSSDLSFDLELVGHQQPGIVLTAADGPWRFLDSATPPSATWTSLTFNDTSWKSGRGRFGYGGDGEATLVDFGPDPNNKPLTVWFRTLFALDEPQLAQALFLRFQRDDGMAIHLNGQEIFRDNLPGGPLTATTKASSGIGAPNETAWFTQVVPSVALQAGVNVLAVEIHQNDIDSSDLGFNLNVLAQPTPYAAWKLANLGQSGNGVASVVDFADPDGDHLISFLEYAFNTSPTVATPPQNQPRVFAALGVGNQPVLALTFRRRTDDPRLHYAVEASPDMAQWFSTQATLVSASPHGDGISETVTYHIPAPEGKMFARVRVTLAY